MRQELQKMLSKVAATLQSEETEPEGESTKIYRSSPPRVTWSHHQHLVDYVKLFMEEREKLTPGVDHVAPLNHRGTPLFSHMIYFPIPFNFLSSILLKATGYKDTIILLSHLQALQKIHLASHI